MELATQVQILDETIFQFTLRPNEKTWNLLFSLNFEALV